MSDRHSLAIRHVFPTHFHADVIAGHLEPREGTGATIGITPSKDTMMETLRTQPSIATRVTAITGMIGLAISVLHPSPVSAGQAAGTVLVVPCGTTGDINAAVLALQGTGTDDTIVLDGQCTYSGASVLLSAPPGKALTIEGNGATIEHTAEVGSTVYLFGGLITVRDVTITGGKGDGAFDDNGGGGVILATGDNVLERVTITGNTADFGGGVGIGRDSTGSLRVVDSLITGNTANRQGGGMWVIEWTPGQASVSLVNSTVSGNHGVRVGGIVYTARTNHILLDGSTVYGNTSDSDTGGVSYESHAQGPAFPFRNSVIAGNVILSTNRYHDCQMPRHSSGPHGYNVYGPTCWSAFEGPPDPSIVDTSAADWFEPLADNGGPTLTHLPRPGTPMIDMIPFGVNGCGTTFSSDQRGMSRPQGVGCEPGAVELSGLDLPEHLRKAIMNVGLPKFAEKSLLTKVRNVERSLQRGQAAAACSQLADVLYEIADLQTLGWLTADEAAELTASAAEMQALIGC